MSDIKQQLIDIAEGYEYWHNRAESLKIELYKLDEFLQEEYPDEFEKFFKTGLHTAVDLAMKLLATEEQNHE